MKRRPKRKRPRKKTRKAEKLKPKLLTRNNQPVSVPILKGPGIMPGLFICRQLYLCHSNSILVRKYALVIVLFFTAAIHAFASDYNADSLKKVLKKNIQDTD